ncbi:MAG: alpha-galactosidase [Acidobacteriia bacterium]|nr:alpha-galactosidase [Terriglobia bacterium]
MNSHRRWWIVFWWLSVSAIAVAQTSASLETAETHLRFEAGQYAPQLSVLQNGTLTWKNHAAETLIPTADIDGQTVAMRWSFNRSDSRANKSLVTFVYDAASPHLRLTWEWEVRSGHGPIEHQIRIENRDSRELWLPLQNSFVFDWQTSAADRLEQFYVEKGADTPSAVGTHLIPVPDGYEWEGTSSTYAQPRLGEAREIIPYFLVERADETQPGWYVGIEFSGRTHLTLARKGESLHGEVGLNPNPAPFRTRLKPGEIFETPRIFLGATSGGPDATANVLRQWVRDVLTNQEAWKDPHYPLAVNNSWGGGMVVNEEIALRMIHDSAKLGLEMFHVDAGWFRGVGDWYPDPKKFPHGLQPIADEAHTQGMKFGLWVDWAQAALATAPGALNIRNPEVRDWLTTDLPATWKPEEFKGQTIDISAPKAKEWALRETDRIVTDYKLDMLEHDGYLVAQGCDASDHPHAAPDPLNRCTYRDAGFVFVRSSNSTDVSYHAVRAYYDIQSNLHRKHPGLLLEVCNDGGRMVDFGSAAHGDYFSITDTYDPLSNRRAFYDTSFVLPPAMLEAYVERWPTPKIENFRYMLRSGMMGWLSIMIDTTSWDARQHEAAKEEIRLYKSQLRPLIRDANLYHISERPDGVRWDGMEYFDSQAHRGIVYAFRGSTKIEAEHTFVLRGLDAASRYRLRFHDHSANDQTIGGDELMKAGLAVRLPIANSSEIIFLEELPTHVPPSPASTTGELQRAPR